MNAASREAVWQQFGAAIDMLEGTIAACPDALWNERLWPETPPEWFSDRFAEFWLVAYHSLVWLDLYLRGVPEEEFTPPPPFMPGEVDSPATTPEDPFTKDQLTGYLRSLRTACRERLLALTDEEAGRVVDYPWTMGQPVTYAELLLYNLRHLAGHAAQLSLFLGQHGVPGDSLDWVTRADAGTLAG